MTVNLTLERLLPKRVRDEETTYLLNKFVTLANHLWDRLQWIGAQTPSEETEREHHSVVGVARDLWLALEWARAEYAPIAAKDLPPKLAVADPRDAFGLAFCLLGLDLPVRTIEVGVESRAAVDAATNLLLQSDSRRARG